MSIPCFHGTALVAWPRYVRRVMDDTSTLRCPNCKAEFNLPDTDGHGLTVHAKCPGFDPASSVPGTCAGILRYGKRWTRIGVCDCKKKKS